MGGEVFFSPFGIIFTVVIVGTLVATASAFHYRKPDRLQVLSVKRLVAGYSAIVFCCAVTAGFSSYIPLDEAVSKWHVAPDDYWSVQIRDYVFTFFFTACLALVGVAVVGVPIVFRLARFGWATAPAVLLASVLVSLVTGLVVSSGDHPAFLHLGFWLQYVVSQHLFLALGFCLAAGIPWSRKEER
jgi:hypothetical protein